MKRHNPAPRDRSRSPEARRQTINRHQIRRLIGKDAHR